jgi:hypothetical protein
VVRLEAYAGHGGGEQRKTVRDGHQRLEVRQIGTDEGVPEAARYRDHRHVRQACDSMLWAGGKVSTQP